MVDPITGAVVAKAMGNTSPEMQQATANLFSRIFGPSADAIGEALGRYTTYRLRNVGRIVNRADVKSGHGPNQGMANPRVSHVLLEEGSYCDNEVMVDYLGGVLAASRTPDGRDDRAVAWSNLVTSLSSLQVRAHYLLYREWAARLHDLNDLNLGVDGGRSQALMQIELEEFYKVLVDESDVELSAALSHSIVGLVRVGLLGDSYSFGPTKDMGHINSGFESVLAVSPSVTGIELYGWAQGLSGLSAQEFISKATLFDPENPIPRFGNIEFPMLPKEASRSDEVQ